MSRLAISILILLAIGCAHSVDRRPTYASPSDDFNLRGNVLRQTISRANKGDVEAMHNLYMHYSVALGDNEHGNEWLERAAEAGDIESRHEIICIYSKERTEHDKSRLVVLSARWSISPGCHSAPDGS